MDMTPDVVSTVDKEPKILFYISNTLKDVISFCFEGNFLIFICYSMLDSEEMFYKAKDLRVQFWLSNTEWLSILLVHEILSKAVILKENWQNDSAE